MRRDACTVDVRRLDMAVDVLERAMFCARSLRQMVRASQPFAMVPLDLTPRSALHAAIEALINGDGVTDERFGNLCGAVWEEVGLPSAVDVAWVCLRAGCDGETGVHGWPAVEHRARSRAALLEQVDPIARLERRALFAIEGASAHPLLAGGMPSA